MTFGIKKVVADNGLVYIYDDAEGLYRDAQIEEIFWDIITNNVSRITIKHLSTYASLFTKNKVTIKRQHIYTDVDGAIDVSSKFGYLTLWKLDKEAKQEVDDVLGLFKDKKNNLIHMKYGAKIGNVNIGDAVYADTLCKVIILACVQVIREVALDVNNPTKFKSQVKH